MTSWTLETHDRVALLTFARPPRNFMHMDGMTELDALLADLEGNDDVAVVVLTGGLPGYFVAHADLDELHAIGEGRPVEGNPLSWFQTLGRIESMPQPVVAAVNGQAWGGGCELALACTMRVAAQSAHFSQPEVAVGLIPGAGGTQRLPRVVGPGRAAELILSGRVLDAAEAARIGLVEAVLPDDGFVGAVLDWLAPLASGPRHALVAAKAAVRDGLDLPLRDGLAREGELFVGTMAHPETVRLERQMLDRYAAAGDEPVTFD